MVEEMKDEEEYLSNLNSKCLSHYLQEFEHVIMDEVFMYCVSKNILLIIIVHYKPTVL